MFSSETNIFKNFIICLQIFRLEPKVAGLEQPENETPDADKEIETAEEKAERFRNVTQKYSTKKNIRKVCCFLDGSLILLLSRYKSVGHVYCSLYKFAFRIHGNNLLTYDATV